jgi:hypothetical protein
MGDAVCVLFSPICAMPKPSRRRVSGDIKGEFVGRWSVIIWGDQEGMELRSSILSSLKTDIKAKIQNDNGVAAFARIIV